MGTDFFERQDLARRNTAILVSLFVVAVLAIVATVFVIAFVATESLASVPEEAWDRSSSGPPANPWAVAAVAAAFSLVLILGGSGFKVMELRSGGGRRVAESVGGRYLSPDRAGPEEQQLLNIVEEMAIASGTPVPPVFLLEDDSINAFAAGYSSKDAVIGVTRGAVHGLTRDELQGVIAHEFSHVLHGDMRQNINLIGVLHGVLLLSLIGKILLHSLRFSGGRRRGKDDGKGIVVILAVGLTLYVLGSIGAFLGGLIKAAVSRQREYLADASAVQYTRNPQGIGGALLRIGARQRGNRLQHANAAVASHMYFSQGVFEGFSGLMATHPPVEKRVRAILPRWDGSYPEPVAPRRFHVPTGRSDADGPTETAGSDRRGWPLFGGDIAGARGQGGDVGGGHAARQIIAAAAAAAAAAEAERAAKAGTAATDVAAGQASPDPETASATPGTTARDASGPTARDATGPTGRDDDPHRRYAEHVLRSIPAAIRQAAREPSTARSVVLALLLDEDMTVRRKQLNEIGNVLQPNVPDECETIWMRLAGLEPFRLAILDLSIPALADMSEPQYVSFSQAVRAVIRADRRLSLFEWTLSEVLRRNLEPRFYAARPPRIRYYSLGRLGEPVSVLLSIVSRLGHRGEVVRAAFDAGTAKLSGVEATLLEPDRCSLDRLRESLDVLVTVAAPKRAELVEACAAAICVDHLVTPAEADLLRGIADLLDCAVPAVVVEHLLRQVS